MSKKTRRPPTRFDPEEFLESAGVKRTIVKYPARRAIFSQGEAAADVFYIQDGTIRLSVLSKTGREAVIGMLGKGDFLGEGCLAGQTLRMGSATTSAPSTVLVIEKPEMVRMLHHGKDDAPVQSIPGVSQEVLAEIVGTTRSRVNFFMNKFRRLGFIEYDGDITIKKSLLSVVLHD